MTLALIFQGHFTSILAKLTRYKVPYTVSFLPPCHYSCHIFRVEALKAFEREINDQAFEGGSWHTTISSRSVIERFLTRPLFLQEIYEGILSQHDSLDDVNQKAQELLNTNSDARISHAMTQVTTKYQQLLSRYCRLYVIDRFCVGKSVL